MTRKEILIVQESFKKVETISETAAALFYERLFDLDPALRNLFKGDMREQGKKLMKMIRLAVMGLDQIEVLIPLVEDLGKRHQGYGVKDFHYQTVGEALLWTLDKGLGDEFTEKTRQAWTNLYQLLSVTMKNASKTETVEFVKL